MRTILAITLGLAFLAVGHAQDKKEVPKELLPLQGKWKGVKMVRGGAPINELPDELMEFDGNKVYQVKNGERRGEKKVIVDSTKTPMWINLNGDKSNIYGIWKLEKDKLTLCFVHGGSEEKDRPAKFESPKDTQVTIVELEKAK